jgi:MFS family permease
MPPSPDLDAAERPSAAWAPLTRGIAPGARPAARLFVAGTVLFWASLYTYVPILPAYVEQLSGSLEAVAWVVGAYGVTQLAFRIPLGVWSDRLGARKPFVLAGLLVSMVSAIGMAVARTPALLFAFRALAGTAAATWGLLTVLFAGYFAPPNPHRAMTIMQVASALAQIAAALLGGWAASRWGWTASFYAGAVLAALSLACLAAVPDETRAGPRTRITAATVIRIAGVPVVAGASIAAALGQFGFWVTVNGFTPIYAVRLGASPEVLGILAMVSLVPYALAPIFGDAVLVLRFRERHVVALGFLVVAATTLAIPAIHSIPLLMLSQAIGGVGRGLVFPILMSSTIEAVAPGERATAMGFFQATYALGMTAGPWVAGWLVTSLGLGGVFVMTAGLMGLAAVLALRLLR